MQFKGVGMRLLSVPLFVSAFVLAASSLATAAPITVNVAEFRWNVVGEACDPNEPTSDTCLSLFSLTYLWDGPPPEPVVSGELAIDGVSFGSFFDLNPSLTFDQFALPGVPTTAQASISFLFGGQVSLSALLNPSAEIFTPEGIFHVFQHTYDDGIPVSVPEPSTLALASLGLLAAWRSRARA